MLGSYKAVIATELHNPSLLFYLIAISASSGFNSSLLNLIPFRLSIFPQIESGSGHKCVDSPVDLHVLYFKPQNLFLLSFTTSMRFIY